jgi:hypothetical protein
VSMGEVDCGRGEESMGKGPAWIVVSMGEGGLW